MAEVIGIVASVAQLVQISGEILTFGYGFVAKVSRAPTEMRQLLAESAGLNCVLDRLQSIAESSSSSHDALRSLHALGI